MASSISEQKNSSVPANASGSLVEFVCLPKAPPATTDENDPAITAWAEECVKIMNEACARTKPKECDCPDKENCDCKKP